MKLHLLTGIRVLVVLTVTTGFLYPLFVTAIAQLALPRLASGSLVVRDGQVVGSDLIGQPFHSPRYFWSRPSAVNDEPMPSGASNLGPTSLALRDSVNDRRKEFIELNFLNAGTTVPPEMLFASASGVDPDISPEAARMQLERISQTRGLDSLQRRELIDDVERLTQDRQWGLFGERRVNVFRLNLALDAVGGTKNVIRKTESLTIRATGDSSQRERPTAARDRP